MTFSATITNPANNRLDSCSIPEADYCCMYRVQYRQESHQQCSHCRRRTWRYCGRYVSQSCGLYYDVYPSPLGSAHGNTKGVFAHLGHTATIRAPRTPRQGNPGGSGRHDLWQVTVHTVTGAARQDPESVIVSSKVPTCPNPGASHARVLEQLDTRLVSLASRQ